MKEQDQSAVLMDVSNRIHAKFESLLSDLELNDDLADVMSAASAYSTYIVRQPEPSSEDSSAMSLMSITLSFSVISLITAQSKCREKVQQMYGSEKANLFFGSIKIPATVEVTLEMLQDLTKDWNYTPAPMNNGQTIH